MRSTHSQQLERWVGREELERCSRAARGWYGPPIPLAGVPGRVYVCGDGDFVGPCHAGYLASWMDYGRDLSHRLRRQRSTLHTGFSSVANFLTSAKIGKRQEYPFQLAQVSYNTGVAGGGHVSYWQTGNVPPAGTAASAAPGGRVPTYASGGGINFINAPVAGDTSHFFAGWTLSTGTAFSSGGQLLLYDRIFDVSKTMSSTATEAVTGVPTRYQNQTDNASNSIAGNFAFIEIFTTLGAGAHNWTVCKYTNSGGAAGTFPSMAGISGAAINKLDHQLSTLSWFLPLAAGDYGVKNITQMQCDTSLTGAVNFVIGHPIAWFVNPIVGLVCEAGGLKTAFNFARIFDNACLSFLEVCRPLSSLGTSGFNGQFTVVS